MKRSHLTLFVLALGSLFVAGAAGRAASVSLVSWNYNWTPSVPAVFSDSKNSKITLTNEMAGVAVGPSDIVATNLKVFSTADPGHPDTFTNVPYTLALVVTDKASGKSATLQFTGAFNGTVSAAHSLIRNKITSPITQAVTLGQTVYTVTMGQFTPPAPPGAVNFGSLSAEIVLSSTGGTGNGTPEPSTLALAGLGLFAVALACRAGRRNRVSAVGAV